MRFLMNGFCEGVAPPSIKRWHGLIVGGLHCDNSTIIIKCMVWM